jgi:pimeloyl-ACP methyl ester carboxylesterase
MIRAHAVRFAIAVLLALGALSDSTAVAAHAQRAQTKPTIVLVHGAWADGSSWSGVIQRLQQSGYAVFAPPNPLRGIASDAATIAAFVNSLPAGPVVLVGHSYGGAVITNAATSTPNVKALVFVNAFAPDQGETLLQLVAAKPGSALGGNPANVFNPVPYPGAPAGDADLYIKQTLFPSAFANDLPARTARVLASTQRPLAGSAAATPSGVPAWKTIPSWYLVGTQDHVIPPAEQRIMATRAKAQTVEVKASHLSMISHPADVAKLIVAAAGGS